MLFGEKVVNSKTNPACDKKEDNGDDFSGGFNVHLSHFDDGFDTQNDANDVNNCCDHSFVVLNYCFDYFCLL